MFKPLLRLSIIATIWLKFGRQIVLGLVLILAIYLLQLIAQDVNEYLNNTSQTEYLGQVLLIKWTLILILLTAYGFFLKTSLTKKSKAKPTETSSPKAQAKNKAEPAKADPFAQIRDKKVLRSKGDILIEKQNQKHRK